MPTPFYAGEFKFPQRDHSKPLRWKTRREERKLEVRTKNLLFDKDLRPPDHYTIGQYTGLCLLIQFPDVNETLPQQEVDDFCNQPGYTRYGNHGSVYDYFFAVSGGKLEYTNIISSYYTAQHAKSYYTDEQYEDGIKARELITEALNNLVQSGFDFSMLSSDSGGYVFAINAFYAGSVENRWPKGLWPHSASLDQPFELASGKWAYDYQVTNLEDELSLGTFCHENGHMLCSFPDLYSYDNQQKGNGVYCLMCLGGNLDPKRPAQVGAYLKFEAGWVDSFTHINGAMSAAIRSDKNDFFMFSRNDHEFFIIENRQQSGYDAALPDKGLAIWLINTFGDNTERIPNVTFECSLIQADGKRQLDTGENSGDEADLFRKGSNDHFGPSTIPASNWYDGKSSGLDIREISVPQVQMSFSIH